MPSAGYTHGSGRVSVYDPTLSTGYATSLWRTCPLWEYAHDPYIGVLLDERWQSYDPEATNGEYVLTQATTGAAAISTAAPGVLELDSNSTTATQGATLQHNKAAFVPAAGKHIWAEFKFKIVDTFDKAEIFVGLSELDTTLIATSANSSANHIGWQCVTDDGVLLFSAEKAGTGATKAAATIVEDTYIRLGFYVNGVTEVEQYVNGALTGTNHVTANIPIVALYPSFVCQSGGTNDPIMHLMGYRIFQLR
jgi:hypothetical protein